MTVQSPVLLRITHLSRTRPAWTQEHGYDGWFIRFAGCDEQFHEMRAVMKSLSRIDARWTPEYEFEDGKCGAWWIDEDVLLVLADSFSNLDECMRAAIVAV